MEHLDEAVSQADVQKKADRAKLIIYVVMFLFMMLPVVAAWLSGALRFLNFRRSFFDEKNSAHFSYLLSADQSAWLRVDVVPGAQSGACGSSYL